MNKLLSMILLLMPILTLFARDFPDATGAAFPGQVSSELGFFPAMAGSFTHQNAIFLQDDVDSFLFRLENNGAFYRWENWALGYQFDSILLGGPLAPGETAAAVVGFWLNAVQFEYGLAVSYLMGDLEFSLQYDRQSLHPLRSPYAETAYDVLKAGVLGNWHLANWQLQASAEYGYYLLWPIWESHLPDYRYRHSLDSQMALHWDLGILDPFLRLRLQSVLTPMESSGDRSLLLDASLRAGLRIEGSGANMEPFVFYTHVTDSELVTTGAHAQNLVGIGIQMGVF